jgi:hypothetical protein
MTCEHEQAVDNRCPDCGQWLVSEEFYEHVMGLERVMSTSAKLRAELDRQKTRRANDVAFGVTLIAVAMAALTIIGVVSWISM